ncbi:MAG TPA: hypothetical protein PK107_01100 [Candidatus Omnitrophota bacterium]|nr:hypothetical protein [Candidatus Omnitrophota bacterium]
MVAIILGVLVTIGSLMLAFFLAVSNVSFIVENDFMAKAKQNAVIHALSTGQLEVRAKTLTEGNSTTVDPGYLRDFRDGTYNNMTYNITYDKGAIDVTVKVK